MPQLIPYESRVSVDGTSNVRAGAESFGAASARATSQLGAQMEAISEARVKMQTVRDLSRARVDMVRKLDELKTSPDFAAKFGEDAAGYADFVQKEYETFANTFLDNADPRARAFAEEQLLSFGQGVMADSLEYQATIGAQSIKNTLDELINEGMSTVAQNPQMRDVIMEDVSSAIAEVPHLDAAARADLVNVANDQMTQAQMTGMLRQNPYELKAALAAGGFIDVDFETRQAAIDAADSEIQRREREAEAANDERVDKKYEQVGLSLLAADGEYDAADIVSDGDFELAQKRTLLNVYKEGFTSAGNARLHQSTYLDILRKQGTEESVTQADLINLLDPDFTPEEQALSANEYEDLVKLISEPVEDAANNFVSNAKTMVTTSNGFLGMADPQGDQRYGQFMIKARQMARMAGQPKTPYGDLSDITPYDMFLQDSKFYSKYGGALLKEFSISDSEAMNIMFSKTGPEEDNSGTRLPNETPAEYLARRGKEVAGE